MVFSRAAAIFLMIVLTTAALSAQMPPEQAAPRMLPRLTGPQKRTLILIAREAVDAAFEGRDSRQATVEARLTVPQPLVVSIYVDGELRGRAWRLKPTQPLYLDARDVTYEAVDRPRDKGEPLRPEELARAEVGLAVLGGYVRVEDDRDVPPKSAVVVFSGFTEAVGIPGDVDSDKTADLLSSACGRAGLRPNVWLLPQSAIFYSQAEITRENADY